VELFPFAGLSNCKKPPGMALKLWVKFGSNNAVKVSTEQCQDVDDFLEACKKKLLFLYGQFPPGELSLSTSYDGPSLRPGLLLSAIPSQPGYSPNSGDWNLWHTPRA
jgi:hypothetical protein